MSTERASPRRSPKVKVPPGNWTPATERYIVGAVALLAIAARYYAVSFHPLVAWDGTYYINYFRDPSWRWIFPPGYPLAIEFFRFFIADAVLAAQLASVVFGGLLVIPLYIVAREFLDSRAALAATVIAVFNPLMVRYGAMAMSEAQFIFFALTAFACYRRRFHVLFGAASGIAYLTRPEALVFFVLILGYDALTRRDLKFIGLSLAGLCLFALPYIISLRVETGTWSLSPKSQNLRVWDVDWRVNIAREGAQATPEPAPTGQLFSSSLAAYPERFLAEGGNLLTYAGLPLLLAGLYGMVRDRNILLAGLAMFFLVPFFGLNPFSRFVLPYIPFLAIFALLALRHLPRAGLFYAGVLVCILGTAPTLSEISTQDDNMIELKTAALAIQPRVKPGDVFLDRKPYTAFYANGRYTQIPNEPIDTILAFAKKANARFLVLGEWVVHVFRPQLKPLLYGSEQAIASHGLTTIYVDALRTGKGVRILEINK